VLTTDLLEVLGWKCVGATPPFAPCTWVNLYSYQKLTKSLLLSTSHYTDRTVVHIVTTVLEVWNTCQISGFRPTVVEICSSGMLCSVYWWYRRMLHRHHTRSYHVLHRDGTLKSAHPVQSSIQCSWQLAAEDIASPCTCGNFSNTSVMRARGHCGLTNSHSNSISSRERGYWYVFMALGFHKIGHMMLRPVAPACCISRIRRQPIAAFH
jgi:hypothetical protein